MFYIFISGKLLPKNTDLVFNLFHVICKQQRVCFKISSVLVLFLFEVLLAVLSKNFRYIEGLNVDNRFISPWEKTLQATQENTPPPDPEKLNSVTAWLGTKANQPDVLNALWALRNQLLRDTLGLQKAL